MTEQPQFDPRDYGRLRAEAERARQEESAALHASMSTAAAREEYRLTSAQLRATHQGLYPGATGQDLAAEVAERPARVGDGVGSGRDLVAQGATYDWRDISDSPAPALADMRRVNQPGRLAGMFSLKAYMAGQR